jgi:hypothetical protein
MEMPFLGRRDALQVSGGMPATKSIRHKGGALMVFEEHDFTRNPIVENHTFLLESKCARCGAAVLAHSLAELLQKEELHRMQCTSRRAA